MKGSEGFWHKICAPLDGFLWKRDITHYLVRPALRNQILATGASILAGAVLFTILPWIFWFGCGMACISWIFWSWAKFFLNTDLGSYSATFLRAILFRFFLRLILISILLYFALAYCQASAPAIVTGMICGSFLGLFSYAYAMNKSRRTK